MLDRLEFLISEAFTALRRNLLMAFAAITTVAVSLYLIGGLGYTYFRVQDYAKTIPSKFEMRLFLKDAVRGEAAVSKLAGELRQVPGIKEVTWIPRDKYWAYQKTQLPKDLTDGIENPYPESFKVQIQDLSQSEAVASTLQRMPETLKLTYLKEEELFIQRLLQALRLMGVAFGGLLFLTGGILIYNAIKLTAHARRTETRIMQLVGASRFTVRVPFLIEGMIQGALGGALASVMVMATNNVCLTLIRQLIPTANLPTFPVNTVLSILLGVGCVYGLMCSLFAMRTPLREMA